MKWYSKFLAIVAVLALVAAACGDSGSSGFDEATGGTASANDVFGGDDSDDSPFDSDDTIPITVGNIPGVSDECEALVNLFLGMGSLFLGGDIPSINAAAIGGLPGGLQGDAQFVLDAFSEYGNAIEDLGIDLNDPESMASLSLAQQQAFGELANSFDTDEFNSAIENLTDYAEQECDDFNPLG